MAYFSPAFDASAIEAQVASLQQLTSPIESVLVSGSPISGHTFSNLEAVSVLNLEISWVKGTLSNSALLLLPNGIATNALTIYTQGDGGGGPGDLPITRMVLAIGNRGPGGRGEATIDLTTGRQRTGLSLFGIGGDPGTPTSNRNCYGYLLWNDDATVITSMQLLCVDPAALTTPVADILPGSRIDAYKRR